MLVAAAHLGQVSKFQWSVPGAVAPAMSRLGSGRPAGSVCGNRPATHHAQAKKLIHRSTQVKSCHRAGVLAEQAAGGHRPERPVDQRGPAGNQVQSVSEIA